VSENVEMIQPLMRNIINIFGFWWPSEESEICSPDQEVCTKFQFQSSHERINCTHNPAITKYLPVPMPNPCLNEKGWTFEFEF
jgi:hypothetical protein